MTAAIFKTLEAIFDIQPNDGSNRHSGELDLIFVECTTLAQFLAQFFLVRHSLETVMDYMWPDVVKFNSSWTRETDDDVKPQVHINRILVKERR